MGYALYAIAMKHYAIDANDVRAAATRIAGRIHRTPIVTSATLDARTGLRLKFKCELWQKTGSFKFRGATHAITRLSDADAARGVVTHSSGNHAQALALAARQRGIPATVVMPHTASRIKKAAVVDYGATVVECEPNLADRERLCQAIATDHGATIIPPFDHPDVMAGQGTLALELLEDVPDLHALIIPVGGGGMLSGCATIARAMRPDISILGAEPLGADDAARSKSAGKWLPQLAPNSIADGLLTSVGERPWPIIRDCVDAVRTVTEAEIVAAMRLVWERMKLLIEPSAAVGVAVALQEEYLATTPAGASVGIVLCGGNVDLDRLPW
jgi:threonine dehydratase/serine racemase